MAQNKNEKETAFFGQLTKGEDGKYHSEYGDSWTPKQYRSAKAGCAMMGLWAIGLVACAVLRGCEEIEKHKEKAKAAPKTPAVATEVCPTNYVPMVTNHVFMTR